MKLKHILSAVLKARTHKQLTSGVRRAFRITGILAASLSAAGSFMAMKGERGAAPATAFQDIASSGPLTHIYIGEELSAQVNHILDGATGEFFPPSVIPGDCGTFIVINGTLYAPDFSSHGGTATSGLGTYTPFTPISQSPVTGSGTVTDPFKVVTTVAVGTTGLTIQQTDTYVSGDESYRTDIMIINTSGLTANGILYRAADAYLGGSDAGFGFTEIFGDQKAVGASVNPDNTPPSRIEEWIPLTGGNNFYENSYDSVWAWIGSKLPFPDTCDCTIFEDNGAGISWNFSIPAAGSVTYSQATAFSPMGMEPLVTGKTADNDSSPPGSENGYTITINNPNQVAVTLTSIFDTLPDGFAYVPGSTSGVTTEDPGIGGQTLTWNGPFEVPAAGSVSLHFLVTVATEPGDYFNEAGGAAEGGFTVAGTGPTARITVTSEGTLTLLGVVSRRHHQEAGTFDIDLPSDGSGVENRPGDGSKRQWVVFTFSGTINSVNSITTSCGQVQKTSLNGSSVSVQLLGKCNGSFVTVTLNGISGESGRLDSASASFGVLSGDVNGDGAVDNTDVQLERTNIGPGLIDASNFRYDVTCDGYINHGDTTVTKSFLGTSLH
jgi:uncharacterized repeat protein (TIGR01451 family)